MTEIEDIPEDPAERRARLVAAKRLATGIDEAMIERLVRTFYGRIREHAVLGPIFDARVTDWENHMARLCAFWSSIALASGAYRGSPMRKHVDLPIDGRHFDAWMDLFIETAREICPPVAAELFIGSARRIAESLELAIAARNDVLLFKGDRLRRPDGDVFFPGETSEKLA